MAKQLLIIFNCDYHSYQVIPTNSNKNYTFIKKFFVICFQIHDKF